MIGRDVIGRTYPDFHIALSDALCTAFDRVFAGVGLPMGAVSGPPYIWPGLLTCHGTACLLTVWEDLGVDPLSVRLVNESFEHHCSVSIGEKLLGRVTIESVNEVYGPERGIEQEIGVSTSFFRDDGNPVAGYSGVFRIPAARTT